MIREKFVQDVIIKWLQEKGFKMSPVTNKRFGIDIQAYNYAGEYYYIECKGETVGENSYLDFTTALGQLILRMDKELKPWRHYGLGIPATKHFQRQYEKFLKSPPPIRKILKIRFLFVDSLGNIKEVKSY